MWPSPCLTEPLCLGLTVTHRNTFFHLIKSWKQARNKKFLFLLLHPNHFIPSGLPWDNVPWTGLWERSCWCGLKCKVAFMWELETQSDLIMCRCNTFFFFPFWNYANDFYFVCFMVNNLILILVCNILLVVS